MSDAGRGGGWLAAQIAVALLAAVVGLVAGAAAGAFIYSLIWPAHGCGNIGCWDFLVGALVGGVTGVIVAPIASVVLMRRARPAAAGGP